MQIAHRGTAESHEAPGTGSAVPTPTAQRPGDPVEVELKLAVPAAAARALEQRLQDHGPAAALTVDSVYFDTPARTLALKHCALRVRRIQDGPKARWVQTLKTGHTDAALTSRGEWEVPVAGPRLAPTRLSASPLRQLLGDVPAAQWQLAPVFRTRFDREVRQARFGGTLIEIAFDRGFILSGRRREPICELELELCEAGAGAGGVALYGLALALIGRGPGALALLPSVQSKALRGYRLADRRGPAPAFAGADGFAAVLDAAMDRDTAAHRLVEHGVNRVLANVAGAAQGMDLEFVHQSRVALRRTRSALRLLGVACAPDDAVSRQLRWMADRYGAIRDWDVLVTQWLPELADAIGVSGHDDWARLMVRAERRRRLRREQLDEALSSARFARTALRLLQWTQAPAGAGPGLNVLAPAALQRGHLRVLAAGRDLAQLAAKGRHRLRILAKRQRYALELLAPVVSLQAPARALKLLSRLQQSLGEINDIETALSVLPSLTASRQILDRAERWGRRQVRRSLPKAAAQLERLEREGFER